MAGGDPTSLPPSRSLERGERARAILCCSLAVWRDPDVSTPPPPSPRIPNFKTGAFAETGCRRVRQGGTPLPRHPPSVCTPSPPTQLPAGLSLPFLPGRPPPSRGTGGALPAPGGQGAPLRPRQGRSGSEVPEKRGGRFRRSVLCSAPASPAASRLAAWGGLCGAGEGHPPPGQPLSLCWSLRPPAGPPSARAGGQVVGSGAPSAVPHPRRPGRIGHLGCWSGAGGGGRSAGASGPTCRSVSTAGPLRCGHHRPGCS